jgi:hypothetical protein
MNGELSPVWRGAMQMNLGIQTDNESIRILFFRSQLTGSSAKCTDFEMREFESNAEKLLNALFLFISKA